MKRVYVITISCIAIYSCNSIDTKVKKQITFSLDSAKNKVDSNNKNKVAKILDSSYYEKKINSAICSLNDTFQIIYFKDTIRNIECELYLKTDLNVIDSVNKPENSIGLDKMFENNNIILRINKVNVNLNVKIKESKILLPTLIASFELNGNKYLIVKMNLISSMPGDFWYNLLLQFNSKGSVINQKGIETNKQITFKMIKKYTISR